MPNTEEKKAAVEKYLADLKLGKTNQAAAKAAGVPYVTMHTWVRKYGPKEGEASMSHEDTAQKKATAKKKLAEAAKSGSTASPKNHGRSKAAKDEWKTERELPVKLSADDLGKFKDSILGLLNTIDILRGEQAEKAGSYRAQIKVKESELTELRASVETSTQKRMVVCREVPNWAKGTVTIFRTDTEERVEERQMLPDERQKKISDDVEKAKPKTDPKK